MKILKYPYLLLWLMLFYQIIAFNADLNDRSGGAWIPMEYSVGALLINFVILILFLFHFLLKKSKFFNSFISKTLSSIIIMINYWITIILLFYLIIENNVTLHYQYKKILSKALHVEVLNQ